MRFHIFYVLLAVGCTPQADRYSLTDEELARLHPTVPRIQPSSPKPREVAATSAAAPAPAKPSEPEETPEQRCARTRPERVELAKQAIKALHDRIAALEPAHKWLSKHKCELKDTTGSTRYLRTRERDGSIRIRVVHGRPDDLICDTPDIPDDIRENAREVYLYENTDPDEIMFQTLPECDASERPSLRVQYNDFEGQKAILALP
jgi:hypothetical protein